MSVLRMARKMEILVQVKVEVMLGLRFGRRIIVVAVTPERKEEGKLVIYIYLINEVSYI